MSDVTCENSISNQSLTVGDVFTVRCRGVWSGDFSDPAAAAKSWELRADGNEFPYVLKLLKMRKISEASDVGSPVVVDLDLTSYRLGQHELKAVQIVSADHSVLIGDLSLTVNTVQKPEEPVTEPYGPFPPIPLEFPWPFIIIVTFAVVTGLFLALRPSWIRHRDRRWMQQVPLLRWATAEQELYRIVRVSTHLDELDQGFRHFLARKFTIPAHRLSTGKILKRMMRAHPALFERHGALIGETLVELIRARDLGDRLAESDIEGIRARVRKILHALDMEMAKKRGRA